MLELIFGKLLHIRPSISHEGGCLVAKSSKLLQILALGSASRKAYIDMQQGKVRICDRSFWFAKRWKYIPFDQVAAISYKYADMDIGSQISWGAYQEKQLFTVGLKLRNGETYVLFRFYGGGAFVNNNFLPDWWYWQEKLAAQFTRGQQENDSRRFVESLSAHIGVSIVN